MKGPNASAIPNAPLGHKKNEFPTPKEATQQVKICAVRFVFDDRGVRMVAFFNDLCCDGIWVIDKS